MQSLKAYDQISFPYFYPDLSTYLPKLKAYVVRRAKDLTNKELWLNTVVRILQQLILPH